jgi:hypothetical protein
MGPTIDGAILLVERPRGGLWKELEPRRTRGDVGMGRPDEVCAGCRDEWRIVNDEGAHKKSASTRAM